MQYIQNNEKLENNKLLRIKKTFLKFVKICDFQEFLKSAKLAFPVYVRQVVYSLSCLL